VPKFTLLHASDFHLAKVPFSMPPAPKVGLWSRLRRFRQSQVNKIFQIGLVGHDSLILEAFARWLYVNHPALDAVVFTGDLSNTGYPRDLKRALRFLDGPALSTLYDANQEATLGFLNRKFFMVLPGNHDRYRPMPAYLPGGTLFDTILQAYWPGQFQGVWAWCIPNAARNLVVAGADFALSRRDLGKPHYWLPGWLGQGRAVGPHNQLTLPQLRSATQSVRTRSRAGGVDPLILWAIHFDVLSPDESLQLLESASLVRAAREEKVPIILAGHTHETKIKPVASLASVVWPGGITPAATVLVCGTTAQAGASQGNDFQVLTLDVPDGAAGTFNLSVDWYRYHRLRRFVRVQSECRVLA
jgi:3',5'-cyclic AMP phosphodiesterase CpdA